jgi:flagellar biosynthetic protein FliP
VRHLVEMILAMMIGMAALGAVWRGVLALCGANTSEFRLHHAAVVALVMAFDMTVPMVWWMRHRGHAWARGAEMAGAMFVPTLLLIALLQLDAVSGESLIGLEHALMLPAMLAVMFWRLDEYTRPHAHPAAARANPLG